MDKELQLFAVIGSLILIFSIFATKATARFGVPILLVFIAIGMLLGSDGLGAIHFHDFAATNLLGSVALIFILFSGGLSSRPEDIRPIWKEGVLLATVGVLVTAFLMTLIIHFTTGWGWVPSAILSAAISSTDAPAVFGILRTQRREITPRLRTLLELESGSNDPMAVVILLLLIQFVVAPEETTLLSTAQNLFVQVALGGLSGIFFGHALVRFINWLSLTFEGLYPVLTMASVLCIYSLTDYSGGNGYLAVFVAGFVMSGEKFLSKNSLMVFHDGLSWLMQVGMFLTLGLLVNPIELGGVVDLSLIFSFGLIFLARPFAVALSLFPLGHRNWREIAFLSWGGVKGAVAIILATYLLMEKVPHSQVMFNVIFFIVIISLTLQGSTISWFAGKIGVFNPHETPKNFLPYESQRKTNEFIEFEIPEESTLVGQRIFELSLPEEVLVVLIHRDDDDFIPKETTELSAHDRLVCLVNRRDIPEIKHMLEHSQLPQ